MLALGIGAFALLQSLVVPVLTTVQHQLHTSQDTVTWVLTAYLLSASIMTPILGRVGDMTGKKRVFVAALVALAVGSLLAALAPSIGVMIVARVIQGAGGGMLPVAFGIIRDEFPPGKVAGAVGVLAALTAVGAGLGSCWRSDRGRAELSLAVLAAADPDRGGGGGRGAFVPESPVRTPGRISGCPRCCCPGGWSRCWSRERGTGLGLGLQPGDRPAGRGGRPRGGLGRGRTARGDPADRHEDDAADRRVDQQPGRPAHRGGDVRDVRLPARVRADPAAAGYGFGASITLSGLMLLPSTITMFAVGMFAGR